MVAVTSIMSGDVSGYMIETNKMNASQKLYPEQLSVECQVKRKLHNSASVYTNTLHCRKIPA